MMPRGPKLRTRAARLAGSIPDRPERPGPAPHRLTVPAMGSNTALKYRKKPVVIEAEHLSSLNGQRLTDWINENGGTARHIHPPAIDGEIRGGRIEIETLEGVMTANIGDWVIRGVAGEFYPCRNDIFQQTYTPESAEPELSPEHRIGAAQLRVMAAQRAADEAQHALKNAERDAARAALDAQREIEFAKSELTSFDEFQQAAEQLEGLL